MTLLVYSGRGTWLVLLAGAGLAFVISAITGHEGLGMFFFGVLVAGAGYWLNHQPEEVAADGTVAPRSAYSVYWIPLEYVGAFAMVVSFLQLF